MHKKDKNNNRRFCPLLFCWTIDQQNPENQLFITHYYSKLLVVCQLFYFAPTKLFLSSLITSNFK